MGSRHPRTLASLAALVLCAAALFLPPTAAILAEPTEDPCVMVGDLDFGSMRPGQSRTLALRISNGGGGVVTFNNPTGGDVVTWLEIHFSLTQTDLARLHAARLGRGEHIDIPVTFTATAVGVFRDSARIWASVRKCRDMSYWIARVNAPGAQITGYDWREQWIVEGPCAPTEFPRGTKNPQDRYLSEIWLYNTGDAPFIVESIRLEGADATYFELDMSDPLASIHQSDRIRPLTDTASLEPKYAQRVIFRPGPEERVYTCDVVVTTTDGDTARNTLRGIGIESHVQAPATTDFGRSLEIVDSAASERTLSFTTDGTRDVTISGVQIVAADAASANQFTIVNADDLIGRTFPKRSSVDLLVRYDPSTPGAHQARVVLLGDFDPCGSPSAEVRARLATLSVRAYASSPATIVACDSAEMSATIENDGSDSVVVNGMTKTGDPDDAFSFDAPSLPDTLAPGEKLVVRVHFTPRGTSMSTTTFTWDVRDLTGVIPVTMNGEPVGSTLSGQGRRLTSTASIGRDYHGRPGDTVVLDVVLEGEVEDARVDELNLSVRYRSDVLRQLLDPNNVAAVTAGTILEGWSVEVQSIAFDPADADVGVIFLAFTAPAGRWLIGSGVVARLPFLVLDGDTNATEVLVYLTPTSRLACLDITSSPGLVRIDSLPGEALRDLRLSIDEAADELVLEFRLPASGRVVLVEIYNSIGGRLRATTSPTLGMGRASMRVSVAGIPTGQYFVRVVDLFDRSSVVEKVMLVP